MYKHYIKVCKRRNNKKRRYLVLNEAQCKHFPMSPNTALSMFDDLALNKVKQRYDGETVLIVGFAETATAIGNRVAEVLGYSYIHTTREILDCDNVYDFFEEHSHAVNQTLYKIDLSSYDRVVFIEDEVTTGNTILSIVNILSSEYKDLKFGVASIINGMKEEHFKVYEEMDIPLDYLVHIDNSNYSEIANSISETSAIRTYKRGSAVYLKYKVVYAHGYSNVRYGIGDHSSNLKVLDDLSDRLISNCRDEYNDILVLGTEEFMYPAIYIGAKLENELGVNVYCHSTTRSPIAVSNEMGYPLVDACELPSLYDKDRDTFIYNLKKYDKVYIVTEQNAVYSDYLIQALTDAKNDNITLVEIGE